MRLVLVRRLIVGVTLLYAIVAMTVGTNPWARPLFRGLAILWGVVLAMYALRSGTTFHALLPRWRRYVELALSNIAFTLLLAEFALRAYAGWAGDFYWVSGTLEAHRLIPGHDYGNGLRGNQRGYPGRDTWPASTGRLRIAALGDSFLVGAGVPFADNFLSSLERAARVDVCNFGVSGAGPREYAQILHDDVFACRPDLVLLCLFVGNDVTESLPAPRGMDPRGLALYEFARRLMRHAHEQARRAAESSPATLSQQTYREIEARRLKVCMQPVSPAMERKWAACLRYLDTIVSACRSRNVPLAVVLIPDEFQVSPRILEQALRDSRLTNIDLDLPQRRFRQFFAERGMACLDLQPVFQSRNDTYLPQDTHWNAMGHRLASQAIGDWLGHSYHTRGKW